MAYRDVDKQRHTRQTWNNLHPGYYAKWAREHYDPVKNRAIQLKRKFGITPEQYDAILAAQDRRCALFKTCGHTKPGGRGTWHVDHDHVTGKVRGLLCHTCNTHLGIYEKWAANPEVSAYLTQAPRDDKLCP